MENKDILIRLYSGLLGLKRKEIKGTTINKEAIEQALSKSTSYFCMLLQKIFGDIVHIINSELSSKDFSRTEEMWLHYLNEIEVLKVLDECELVKPMVAIWNKKDIIDLQVEDKLETCNGWDMLVILPKNYITCIDINLRNQSELIIVKYSEKNDYLATTVKSKLSKKYISELSAAQSTSFALFNEPKIIENDSIITQNPDCRDIGWWILYAVCMVIMKGSVPSLCTFSIKSMLALELQIRAIFGSLELLPEEECNDAKALEAAYRALDNSLKLPKALFELKGKCNIRTFDSNIIGILTRSQKFVDKSIFIKEILDNKAESRIIITRPRRWGKSLNLSMLHQFLRAEVDNEGKVRERNVNYNLFANGEYKTFHGKTKFIKKLKIAEINNGEYLKYQGRFPFIEMTFRNANKSDFDGSAPSYCTMRTVIQEVYKKHIYIAIILEAKLKTEHHQNKIQKIQNKIDKFDGYLHKNKSSD